MHPVDDTEKPYSYALFVMGNTIDLMVSRLKVNGANTLVAQLLYLVQCLVHSRHRHRVDMVIRNSSDDLPFVYANL